MSTAPPLSNLESISYKVDQGVAEVATGIGFRTTEVHEKLIKYTGAITRWNNELSEVSGGTGSFAANAGAFTTGNLTPLFIEIKNKTTSTKITLCGCMGSYPEDLKSPEGYVMESWDFKFSSITKSP